MTDDPIIWDPTDYPKRHRTRLARAEMWMMLAVAAQARADSIADKPGCGTIPFAEWPADDPMVDLARRYGLTATDLARLFESAADQLETRAMNTGYPDAWID